MARFGLDAWAIAPEGKGHARTERRMVESLAALGLPHQLVAFVRTPRAAELLAGSGVETVVVRDRVALEWELHGLPRARRRRSLDAVLTLTERLPLRDRGPYVVWLFELPTHRISENRRRRAGLYQRVSDLATLALWRRSLRRAARVVAGSRATADELERELPELSGGIPVAYPGLDEGFSPGPGRAGRYLFHLASNDPRDNTETVLAAHARLADAPPLLVGGSVAAPARPPPGVRYLGRVSDDELVALYRGAAAYVDATLYEGFGYQPLEAMACGAPVVASSASSIPEVVGDAGILCDPRSPEAIAAALERVLGDEALAVDLRRRGPERARAFTWERTARTLADALEETLG